MANENGFFVAAERGILLHASLGFRTLATQQVSSGRCRANVARAAAGGPTKPSGDEYRHGQVPRAGVADAVEGHVAPEAPAVHDKLLEDHPAIKERNGKRHLHKARQPNVIPSSLWRSTSLNKPPSGTQSSVGQARGDGTRPRPTVRASSHANGGDVRPGSSPDGLPAGGRGPLGRRMELHSSNAELTVGSHVAYGTPPGGLGSWPSSTVSRVVPLYPPSSSCTARAISRVRWAPRRTWRRSCGRTSSSLTASP